MALFHGIDESLGGIHLLFEEHQCVARLLALVGLVAGVFVQHFGKLPAEAQLGHVTVVQAEGDGAVVLCLHQKVGDNLLEVLPNGLAQGTAGPGIEFGEFAHGLLILFFRNSQLQQDLFFVLPGEVIATFADDVQLQLSQGRIFFPPDLQQQAFLKVAGTDAGWVELLDDRQYPFQFLRCGADALVDGQFVHQ